jgi:DUF1680 family protein
MKFLNGMKCTLSRTVIPMVLVFAAPPAATQEKSLVNMSKSPHAVMTGVNMDDVHWTDGFWPEWFRVCRDSMVPSMWRILDDPSISHAFRNFEIAAGTQEGCHAGPPFNDGDFYKWFESLAAVYMQTRDPVLDSLMDAIIPMIARSQRADGYIHTPVIIGQANLPEGKPEFRERLDFETYNMGHLMTAACVHYRATGKRTLLDVAIKAADFLIAFYEKAPGEMAQNAICPSHYMGVAELYRTTGDERFLELARDLVEIRSLVRDGTDHNQDRIPFRQQTEAVGHAVRANYLYAGVADLVAETGDSTLMRPLESIWNDLVEHKLYITGGCGALYDGVSPDGTSYSPPYIQQVHQAYGRPYQLPGITAHNESCANVGSVLWSWRMLMLTGDARYADLVERTLYNAVLPAVSLDGKRYFYTNPLRVNPDLPYILRWSKEREEYISLCNCCPPNIVRTIAETGSYLYSVSERGIWFHLYGGNTFETILPDGSELSLEEATDYPWDGTIRIELKKVPAGEFSLFLRIPAWADYAKFKITGKPGQIALVSGTYFELRRKWKAGDIIVMELPMRVKLIRANPLVEEAFSQVAVQRGPIVYCLESQDIPQDIRISDLAIPSGIRFREKCISICNSCLIALEGKANIISRGKWDRDLYRELPAEKPETVRIRLIPYYAWGNRGKSEMSVWMAVDY